MPIVRVNAILAASTDFPADAIVNTFHFGAATGTEQDLTDAVAAFYGTTGEWLSPMVKRSTNVHYAVAYDMTDPEPRQPVAVTQFTLPAANASTSLPAETCVCVSYQAAAPSGEQRGRYRGRIYFGPLTGEASEMSGSYPRPDTTLIGALVEGAEELATAAAGLSSPWGVWSRADATFRPLVGGHIDNEFDTQRRRGRRATSRTTWS